MKDDSISRHAARSFICDIYRKIGLTDDQMMTLCKGIMELPSAQPSVSKTEIVGDVISRQAAIDALNLADDKGEIVSLLDVLQIINALPPAQPEQQLIPLTDERLRQIRAKETIRKCRRVFEETKLTYDQAVRILEILLEGDL